MLVGEMNPSTLHYRRQPPDTNFDPFHARNNPSDHLTPLHHGGLMQELEQG